MVRIIFMTIGSLYNIAKKYRFSLYFFGNSWYFNDIFNEKRHLFGNFTIFLRHFLKADWQFPHKTQAQIL